MSNPSQTHQMCSNISCHSVVPALTLGLGYRHTLQVVIAVTFDISLGGASSIAPVRSQTDNKRVSKNNF